MTNFGEECLYFVGHPLGPLFSRTSVRHLLPLSFTVSSPPELVPTRPLVRTSHVFGVDTLPRKGLTPMSF